MDPSKVCLWNFLAPLSKVPDILPQPSLKPKTFIALLKTDEVHVQPNLLPVPVVKGDITCVHISQKYVQEKLKYCQKNLFGRLLLRKGSVPLKPDELKSILQSIWQLRNPWKLTPFPKGYFDIHFSSEEDLKRVWSGGSCSISNGIFRIFQWQPDFNSYNQQLSHAQVWVRFYGLCSEYWHPTTIMEIARGVGIPLQLDQATRDPAYGFYARVLVDIDLTSNQPSFLNVERDDHRGFSVDVIYENLPKRCTKCKAFGHDFARCHQNKEINSNRGRSQSRNPRQTNQPTNGHHNRQVVVEECKIVPQN